MLKVDYIFIIEFQHIQIAQGLSGKIEDTCKDYHLFNYCNSCIGILNAIKGHSLYCACIFPNSYSDTSVIFRNDINVFYSSIHLLTICFLFTYRYGICLIAMYYATSNVLPFCILTQGKEELDNQISAFYKAIYISKAIKIFSREFTVAINSIPNYLRLVNDIVTLSIDWEFTKHYKS